VQFVQYAGISVRLLWFSRYSILSSAISFEMLRPIYWAVFSEFIANSAKAR
jgi:hypothetical protein